MRQKFQLLMSISLLMATISAFGQTKLSGTVRNELDERVPFASVVVKGTNDGTTADEYGNFSISTNHQLPLTLQISSTGLEVREMQVNSLRHIDIVLRMPTSTEVIVSGPTRTRGRSLRAPVTVENLGINTLALTATNGYYERTKFLKGVDHTTSSLTFNTISTRGFNGSGSTRVNQIVDGMDNQAPGLNFFLGNFVGLTELDVESIEILPGASSALYGPGGVNGTILINSKDPYKHSGLSFQIKGGVMHLGKSERGKASPYHDFTFRWAKSFKDKFAFKIGAQYVQAHDWLASDSSNYLRMGNFGSVIPGTRQTDPNYDGVNVYGDETSVNIVPFMMGAIQSNPQLQPVLAPFLSSPLHVSRTGYAERDVIDPKTSNLKLSGALHYRITDDLEAQLVGYWGTGSTIYTGNNRYALKDVKIGQYKLELKHRNWFIRTYTTQENAGESYSATITPIIFNEVWKPSYNATNPQASWYPQYVGAFATGAGAVYQRVFTEAKMAGKSDAEANTLAQSAVTQNALQFHQAARAFADQGRPEAGSEQFKQIFDMVRKVPIPGGGLFVDKSQLWMTEAQYNFNKWKLADIVVGGNIKKYILDSDGTLFIDADAPIKINELGAYAQITRKLFRDFLTLSFSGRYDKNEDFKGRFTPRATALISLNKDNHIRFSYQTAYRFPSTQQKYIMLDVGEYTLLGGLPWIIDTMRLAEHPVYVLGEPPGKPYEVPELQPESVRSFEVGYKASINKKLLIDVYGYWGKYENFLGRNVLVQPSTGMVYSTVINSPTKVNTHGFGAGIDYQLPSNFHVFLNAYSDVISNVPADFKVYFNAPKYRLNAGIGTSGMGKSKRFGFNVLYRWQDSFMWDGELANGLVQSVGTLDAMVMYKFPKIKSVIKIGGTNITNKYYQNAYGNPMIGGVYYAAVGFNIF